jgi:MFS family permease
MRKSFAPLRVPGFARLLTSYFVNELGDAIALVALSILVYDRTGDPLATAALFIAARFLPAFLAPALVARVDQLSVRRVLPAVYTAEALLFLLLAWQTADFLIFVVLLLTLLDGTLALVGRSISRGTLAATLTPHDLLREGNAAFNIAFGFASVAGLAAGGLIVAEGSIRLALLIDAGSFLAIALLLGTSRSLPAAPEERQRFVERFRSGLGYAKGNRLVRMLLAWQALALVFFTLVIPIEVVYAKETLGVGDAGFGLLIATWSGGIVIGSLLYLAIRNRSGSLLVLGATGVVGIGYIGMASVDELLAACVFSVIGGAGNGVQWVSVMTLLQEATPADLQARVVGLLESIGAAAPGLGYLLGGVLTAAFSPPVAYAVAGAGVLALVLVAGAALLREAPAAATGSRKR